MESNVKSYVPLVLIATSLLSCTGRAETPIIAPGFTPTGSSSQILESVEPHQAVTSTVASTATLFPGILTREELQERVDAWVDGETPYEEDDRLLDEMTGEPLRLGVLPDDNAYTAVLLFYNLGHTVVHDSNRNLYLVNMAGFEDSSGGRFAFPLHSGILTDECPTILSEIFEGSRRVNYGRSIYFDVLTPSEFARHAGALQGMTTVVHTTLFAWGAGNNECEMKEDEYNLEARPMLEALDMFLQCDDCIVTQAPDLLKEYMNKVPGSIGQIPYARIYDSQ